MISKRDTRIDFLRALAIINILIAHINPPGLLFELRTFDVPMMTIAMSMSFFVSFKPKENYFEFVIKRFKRLIIPAWIFLVLFFIVFNLVNIFSTSPHLFSKMEYLTSFMLISGIGYVWIIRIFFTVSIFNPFILRVKNIFSNIFAKLFFLSLLLGVQNYLSVFSNTLHGLNYVIINLLIVCSFGYLIISIIGLFIYTQSQKENIIGSLSNDVDESK